MVVRGHTMLLATMVLGVIPGSAAKVNMSDLAYQCNKGEQKACLKLFTQIQDMGPSRAIREAVESLTDQPLLAKIALSDGFLVLQRAALSKLTDQSLIAKVAIEGSTLALQSEASTRVTDPSLLAKIAESNKKWEELRAFIMQHLPEIQLPGWTWSTSDTKIISRSISVDGNSASVTLGLVFIGGIGRGIQFSSGAITYFGEGVANRPETGLGFGVFTVYHSPSSTFAMLPETLLLVSEGGSWRILNPVPPQLSAPPFTPL
jgi:hypothetical protein